MFPKVTLRILQDYQLQVVEAEATVGVGSEEGAGGEGLPHQQSRRGRREWAGDWSLPAAETGRGEGSRRDRGGWRRCRCRWAPCRSGWSCRWAAAQLGGGIAQLGAGRSLRIEDQLAWWSRCGGRRNRRAAGGRWAAVGGLRAPESPARRRNPTALAPGDARAPDEGSRRIQGPVCYCFNITRCFLQNNHCTARAT